MKYILDRLPKGVYKYLTNTSWLLCERITRMIVGVFVGIYVARYLGPGQFGILSFANSYVALFLVFSNLGLNEILIRELVNYNDQQKQLLGTSFVLKLIGSVISIIVLMTVLQLTSNEFKTQYVVFIISCGMIFQSFSVIDLYFQSKVQSKFVVWSQLISLVFSAILKLICIYLKKDLIWFAVIFLIESIVLAVQLIIFYLKNKLSLIQWKFSFFTAKSLLSKSWKLALSGIAVSIYAKIDQVMIKQMIDNEAVGYYSAALRLSEAWYFIPMAVSSSFFPAIIKAKKKCIKSYYDHLQKLLDFLAWISILIAFPITLYSDWILVFLFGNEYQAGGKVLAIHIWTGVFVSIGLAGGNWYIIENYMTNYFNRTITGLFVNITLNLVLIPKYGINGAAYAMLISQITASYIYDGFSKKTRKLFIMKTKSLVIFHRLKFYICSQNERNF